MVLDALLLPRDDQAVGVLRRVAPGGPPRARAATSSSTRSSRRASGTPSRRTSAGRSCRSTSGSAASTPTSTSTRPTRSGSTTRSSWSPSRPTTRRASSTSCSACARPRRPRTPSATHRRSPAYPPPWSARSARSTASPSSEALTDHMSSETVDITVIGAGPVGLATAFWAGMRQASCRIIDSLPEIGGQCTTLYPEKWIFDVPGHPRVLARDLVDEAARAGARAVRRPGAPRLHRRADRVRRRRGRAAHERGRAALAHGDRRRRPRRVRAQAAAALRRRHDARGRAAARTTWSATRTSSRASAS